MFGAVGEWMFRHIAGISPDAAHPGYQHMTVHPKPGGGLTWAKARYESIRGPVETAWKIEGHRFRLEVTVPANCTATVCLPASEAESVTESGVPVQSHRDVTFLERRDGLCICTIASGSYSFESFLSEEMIPQ
jgi:alpha-L-rhamnosidase